MCFSGVGAGRCPQPPHSLHWLLRRWCGQMPALRHSLHLLLSRWCAPLLAPPSHLEGFPVLLEEPAAAWGRANLLVEGLDVGGGGRDVGVTGSLGRSRWPSWLGLTFACSRASARSGACTPLTCRTRVRPRGPARRPSRQTSFGACLRRTTYQRVRGGTKLTAASMGATAPGDPGALTAPSTARFAICCPA